MTAPCARISLLLLQAVPTEEDHKQYQEEPDQNAADDHQNRRVVTLCKACRRVSHGTEMVACIVPTTWVMAIMENQIESEIEREL